MDVIPHHSFFIEAPVVQYRLSDFAQIRHVRNENGCLVLDMCLLDERFMPENRVLGISADTYIRPEQTDVKLKLIRANNIPILPDNMYYTSPDGFVFQLYFPMLPPGTQIIDLVTDEQESDWCYNQYGIVLDNSLLHWGMNFYKTIKSIRSIREPGIRN